MGSLYESGELPSAFGAGAARGAERERVEELASGQRGEVAITTVPMPLLLLLDLLAPHTRGIGTDQDADEKGVRITSN
jgi:hypothetical protein